MSTSILGRIRAIQAMSVSELQAEWSRLYDGEPCRSRNKSYLVKRLCWRVQELTHGGLSERAKERIAELAPADFERRRTPDSPLAIAERSDAPRPRRDPRLPAYGSVISKLYKGRELRVVVHEDGVEFDGTMYSSLTAVAKRVTGSKNINGRLFFGLTKRKR